MRVYVDWWLHSFCGDGHMRCCGLWEKMYANLKSHPHTLPIQCPVSSRQYLSVHVYKSMWKELYVACAIELTLIIVFETVLPENVAPEVR